MTITTKNREIIGTGKKVTLVVIRDNNLYERVKNDSSYRNINSILSEIGREDLIGRFGKLDNGLSFVPEQ